MPERLEELAVLLKDVNRGVFETIHEILRKQGLPPPTMSVIHQVQKAPGTTVSDLARKARLAKSHVSKTVESLAAMGFLEKRPDPEDQRLLRIYPAAKAETHLREMDALIQQRLSAVLSRLSPDQVNAVIEGLGLLKKALDESRKEMNDSGQNR